MAISVNTMRAIDHWVGVPLCAIVSPLVALMDRIKNIFSRGPEVPKNYSLLNSPKWVARFW